MNEVVNFLSENPIQYFATIGVEGRPKVRPFQFMLMKEGKLYFCTSNQKTVYEELKQTPFVEFSSTSPASSWIRVNGKVVFEDDLSIKQTILDENPLVKSIYQNADNPTFEIFYLEKAEATISDFSGNPPQSYKL